MTDVVMTVATVPAILALVNLGKGLGLSGRWSALVAVLLGVGLAAAQAYAPAELYATISGGLILGLAAAGLYDVAPKASEYDPERAQLDDGAV